MGFRDAKAKGGFLNDVDGKIVSTKFTFENVSGDKGESAFQVVEFQVDGSDKVVSQHLFWGQGYDISKDGQTLSMADGSPFRYNIDSKKGFLSGPYFITSLLDHNLDESEIEVEGSDLNASGIVGYRVRFSQDDNPKATAQLGQRTFKRQDGSEGKANRTVLGVSEVYGKDTAAGKSILWGTKKPGPKGVDSTDAIRDLADETIKALIADAPKGVLRKVKISVGAINHLGASHPNKDAVVKLVKSDAYLTEATKRGVFTYDSEDDTVVAA